ncbi:hypothetical protein M0G43_09535 [Subsaxibacter sp. CAU 1640]|uniref:hypothetical protein n=1 Tax=Subsaxibacter sp. CAU 1640 TaxID=2933271 RepID=UPI002005E1F9|nr:hypothetical protein [Subsaxibacter sp. CAU 1640]MCK7590814.1 hypothetical protein [Subsaxibacter sp. CAU 1640]
MKRLKVLSILFLSGIILNSCSSSEDDTVQVATLTTVAISNITNTTAVAGGNISSQGGAEVTARGVCWSTTQNPTINDNVSVDGSGTGLFVSNVTGLSADTAYYLRAYATNSGGTAYGNEVSFTTTNIPVAGSTREFTMPIGHVRDGSSYTLTESGSIAACMYIDGIEFDMDPYAESYTVEFYDLSRTRDGEDTTYPADASRTFSADYGTEMINGVQGNLEYVNWYYVGVSLAVTRITPEQKFFVMASWCTSTACNEGLCYQVDGMARVTVQY